MYNDMLFHYQMPLFRPFLFRYLVLLPCLLSFLKFKLMHPTSFTVNRCFPPKSNGTFVSSLNDKHSDYPVPESRSTLTAHLTYRSFSVFNTYNRITRVTPRHGWSVGVHPCYDKRSLTRRMLWSTLHVSCNKSANVIKRTCCMFPTDKR